MTIPGFECLNEIAQLTPERAKSDSKAAPAFVFLDPESSAALARKFNLPFEHLSESGPGPNISGIPFLITQKMKTALRARGLTDEEIAQLTPKQAHEILAKPDSREV